MIRGICNSSSDTTDDSSRITTTSPLLDLPQELRTICFQHFLTSNNAENDVTFGKGSGLDLSILSVCKSVHDEVSELLYSKVHHLKIPCSSTRCKNGRSNRCNEYMRCNIEPELKTVSIPPFRVLRLLKHIVLEINFETDNRGECEIQLTHYDDLTNQIPPIGMTLLHSTCLQTLKIGLFNHAQRKVGNRRLRNRAILSQMKWLLKPFAYLPRRITVVIDGFDTIEYADMFADLREQYAGDSVPVTEWMEETLNIDVAGPSGREQCTYSHRT